MANNFRQKLHLEPPVGWLNDPNGLCFYKGKYHVYFQYAPENPYGGVKKCWGHFESSDMLNWDFTGTVIFPDIPEDKDGAYSGSAVIHNNIMNVFYTGNVKHSGNFDYIREGRDANVIRLTSKDGHNFSKKQIILRNSDYPPYCSRHVRDPKVWEENGFFKMVLGARTLSDEGCVLIYKSEDLERWQFDRKLSVPHFGYMWECPDMFEIEGRKYLSVSPQGLEHFATKYQNVYSSGYFKTVGEELKDFKEWDFGFDFYAPQTFKAPDGRRILIGWLGMADAEYTNPTAEAGWQHCLTLPREVTVSQKGDLLQNPVKEFEALRNERLFIKSGESQKISLPFEILGETNGSFKINLGGVGLYYDGNIFEMKFENKAEGCGRTVRKTELAGCENIRITADMSSLEVFLGGGRRVISTRFYPAENEINIRAENIDIAVYRLKEMKVNIIGK